MIGITSADDIAELEPEKVVIGIFLATGFDHSAIKWLHESWEEIHRKSGEFWHLLVPVKDQGTPGSPLQLDFSLSDQIREMYGIKPEQAPCIVLDDFNEERFQLVLTLREDERSRKTLMLKMSAFIRAEVEKRGDGLPTDAWRSGVINSLFDKLQLDDTARNLLKLAPQAFSYLRKLLGG